MMGGGDRHPLQLMAILHNHYTRLARIDGSGARGEAAVGALLGIKGFQAGKVARQYDRLGSDGVLRAFELLAAADLDVRGAKDWPDALVMEVLVARLARLAGPPARRR
jgi:DNA polymerase-3 subunit delta